MSKSEQKRKATSKEPKREPSYTSLQGVGRAFEVLEAIAEHPMRASEITERLNLSWATAYRSLAHLCSARYLRKDEESGIYYIGPRMHLIGEAYLVNHPMLGAGADALRALAHNVDATAQLNEREDFVATVLLAVDPRLELIPKTTTEFNFPLHCGSKGHVLLAFSDPEIFDAMVAKPLQPLTERTITDPAKLLSRLEEVRAEGHAVTREDVQIGTASVAAPIFSANGELAGCVCLIVTTQEMTKRRVRQLLGGATTTARQISLRLGWRHGDTPASVLRWSEREALSTDQRQPAAN